LWLSQLETGCGCASAEMGSPVVAPREEISVRITVRIKEDGQHLQFPVRIFTNDPKTPVAVYTVRADAGPPVVRTEPGQINFGEICRGMTVSQRLLLRKPNGSAWPVDESVVVET